MWHVVPETGRNRLPIIPQNLSQEGTSLYVKLNSFRITRPIIDLDIMSNGKMGFSI